MRYKLWVYSNAGYVTAAITDEDMPSVVMIRDVSSYEEDAGKLVWKKAAYPFSVKEVIKNGESFVLAESSLIEALNAEISHKMLDFIWRNRYE